MKQELFKEIGHSKPIIGEIDKVLAKHYDFTGEEFDCIIKHDTSPYRVFGGQVPHGRRGGGLSGGRTAAE